MDRVLFLVLAASLAAYGQTDSRIRLIDASGYITDVLVQTVRKVEERGWSNLKFQDMYMAVNETVLGREINTTLHFTDGFVISIQHIDITTARNETWRGNVTNARVTLGSYLRFHEVDYGFDVTAELPDGVHRYTLRSTLRLVPFFLNIGYQLDTEEFEVIFRGNRPTQTDIKSFLPVTEVSDVFAYQYVASMPFEGMGWAENIFEPIAEDLVKNKVPFPKICYDCPA